MTVTATVDPGGELPATVGVNPTPDGSTSSAAVGVLRPAPKRKPGPRPSEADCQRTIVDAAQTFGYRVLSIRPALNRRGDYRTPIQGDAGYPDLTLVHPLAGVHFVELKRWPNRLEPSQALWGRALLDAGASWHLVWVPEELDRFCQSLADWSHRPWSRRP